MGLDLDDYSTKPLHFCDTPWPSFLAFERAPTCHLSSSGSAAIFPSFATAPSGKNSSTAPRILNRFLLGYPRSSPPFRGLRTRPRSGRSVYPSSRNCASLAALPSPHHSSTPYPRTSISTVSGNALATIAMTPRMYSAGCMASTKRVTIRPAFRHLIQQACLLRLACSHGASAGPRNELVSWSLPWHHRNALSLASRRQLAHKRRQKTIIFSVRSDGFRRPNMMMVRGRPGPRAT